MTLKLLRQPTFWLLVAMMMAAGASEQGMSQWTSAFAQTGLGLSKTMGDLCGPVGFALAMGIARLIFASRTTSNNVLRVMSWCLAGSIAAYLLAALTPWAWLGVVGMLLGGFSVGLLWPGTFTLGSATLPLGGTTMFALLALGGDLGCGVGPAIVGLVGDVAGGLSSGLLVGALFPVAMLVLTVVASRRLRQVAA